MDIDSSGGISNWLYDYGLDNISVADFMAPDSAAFTWLPQPQPHTNFRPPSSNMSLEMEYSVDSIVLEGGPSKRLRIESCASGTKACREKLRRDKLNESCRIHMWASRRRWRRELYTTMLRRMMGKWMMRMCRGIYYQCKQNSEWNEWQTTALQERNMVENVHRWACGRPTALQDKMRDSDDDDLHDRDYDVASLANNLSETLRYKIYGNDDNEEEGGNLDKEVRGRDTVRGSYCVQSESFEWMMQVVLVLHSSQVSSSTWWNFLKEKRLFEFRRFCDRHSLCNMVMAVDLWIPDYIASGCIDTGPGAQK